MNHRQMTDEKFRETMELLAREAALKHYQRRHYGCTPEQAWAFATDNWRAFIDVAADVLALWEVLDSDEGMAAWN